MILKINNADFSENQIGYVEIPWTPSPSTLEILSHYTKPLTLSQQKALETFIANLTINGIYAKIDHLFLPLLANDATEALYDVKADSLMSASGYTLTDNGLVGSDGTLVVLNTHSLTDTHIFGYNTETIQSHMTGGVLPGAMNICTGSGGTYQQVKYDTASKNNSQYRNSANNGVFYCAGSTNQLSTVSAKTLLGVSTCGGKCIMYKDSSSGFYEYSGTPYDKVNPNYTIMTETQGVPLGTFSTGKGLSLVECQSYALYAETFANAFIS